MLPSALPYFLGGLRIAGGLALIGAIVAEYVAGTGGIGTGLAYTILEASYRLKHSENVRGVDTYCRNRRIRLWIAGIAEPPAASEVA